MASAPLKDKYLSACDRLPVAAPGIIQPHGGLLAIDGTSKHITHISQNLGDIFPNFSKNWLNRALSEVGLSELENAQFDRMDLSTLTRSSLKKVEARRVVTETATIFEFTNQLDLRPKPLNTSAEYFIELLQAKDLADLHEQAMRALQVLTGFGHIMVYQFDTNWNGTVIAEHFDDSVKSFFTSYLNLHFPKQDVPHSARTLYTQQLFRMVADTDAKPISLISAHENTLDLSFCNLRAVLPTHLEYLKNMGVRASLSTSIIVDGKLWGLLAAHHHAVAELSFESMFLAEEIGKLYSAQLSLKLREAHQRDVTANESLLSWPARCIHENQDPLTSPQANLQGLMDMFGASGCWISTDEFFRSVGQCPPQSCAPALRETLAHAHQGKAVFSTDDLRTFKPELGQADYAGLLAIGAPAEEGRWLIFFRPEERQEILWGGDPSTDAMKLNNGKLSPRQSFNRWREIVCQRSRPWQTKELLLAKNLASNLFYAHSALVSVENASQQARLNTLSILMHDIGNAFSGIADNVEHMERTEPMHASADYFRNFITMMQEHKQALSTLFGDQKSSAIFALLEQIQNTTQQHLSENAEYLCGIKTSLNHMRELLALQKSYAHSGTVLRRECVLSELVIECTQITSSAINARGAVTYHFDPRAPKVRIDRSKTIQIITNLIKNAYEAWDARETPDVPLHLKINTHFEAQALLLTIEDNGVGFDPNETELLFTKNFSTKNRSSGIGLLSCKKLAAETGLILTLTSAGPMRGATATLQFKPELWT